MAVHIQVQTADFSVADIYQALSKVDVDSPKGNQTGAIVTFVGCVRDFKTKNCDKNTAMHIEHYPGMTEKALARIGQTACDRWPIGDLYIVHRVGTLSIGEQIVCVGVSAKHRAAAFSASEFIMDTLKTEAPFWKKEGDTWVEAKQSDTRAAERWLIETGEKG